MPPAQMAGRPGLRQRLVALGGIVVIVGGVMIALALAGLLGSQGGGDNIRRVTLLETPPVQDGSAERLDVGPEVGKLAPDFEISDLDGERQRLSDQRGKPVYLNFWATWCGPCQEEMPEIYQLQQKYREDLVVMSINRAEPLGRARDFLAGVPRLDGGKGVAYTIDAIDPDDTLWDRYRGLGMPVSIFIDRYGVVTKVFNGRLNYAEMEEAFTAARLSVAR